MIAVFVVMKLRLYIKDIFYCGFVLCVIGKKAQGNQGLRSVCLNILTWAMIFHFQCACVSVEKSTHWLFLLSDAFNIKNCGIVFTSMLIIISNTIKDTDG